ncbi:NAD-dependent epimerase/dehydratase family protein [Terrabacter aerolatus]|uniref:Epimerase n=1 Tax=Terrabacter aerolatus TaxID=422442 RepID=A0A512CZQ6_9MICO|nr:NAD-dependent epimerase/dehydratase family protein [Terrabacter aerolatus]GEO29697.1 epimerase [Terrabacter aerolatus]
MKIILTGAGGFLGWHTRVRLQALTQHQVDVVDRSNWDRLAEVLSDADAVIHMAGVNRAGSDDEVRNGNINLAHELADGLRESGATPRIIFANSIQAGNGTPYGDGKERAAKILSDFAKETRVRFVDVLLPNLFGEHGRPKYNSFVATFVQAVVEGEIPEISDREVELLHVQGAAASLIEALTSTSSVLRPQGTMTTVKGVFDTLSSQRATYATGDVPPIADDLELDLFNTLRAALFPTHYPIGLTSNEDARGKLVETVRTHSSQGQTFVSTTIPGATRGDHFHLRKVERFVVLSGRAAISLRRLFTDEVITFEVDGSKPVIVDMPTMWLHNITNIGDTEVLTQFWSNELFNPEWPDTYWEKVHLQVDA